MPQTANYGLEYETPQSKPGITLTGDIDGSAPILAEQVDAVITGIDTRLTAAEGSIASLEAGAPDDTGWLALLVTAEAGWSVSTSLYRRWGPLVGIRLVLTRTGAAITAGATGNVVGDPIIVTISTAELRPDQQMTTMIHASVTSGGGLINTGGAIQVTDLNSGSSIATDDNVRITSTYFVSTFN